MHLRFATFSYRNDPHLLGGTSVSVFEEVLLREVLSQEFLLTRFLSGVGDCLKSVVSLRGQKDIDIQRTNI